MAKGNLILSRKIGETIMVGDIAVTVVDIDRGKVRIGIQAPRDIPVHRQEIAERYFGYETPERPAKADPSEGRVSETGP